MMGTIIKCLKELVEEQYGKEQWATIMTETGFEPGRIFVTAYDIDDDRAAEVLETAGTVLGLSPEHTADAFGAYWVNTYAPAVYPSIYSRFSDVRGFLLGLDEVHVQVTGWLANARPPRFSCQWTDDHTLVLVYSSHRKLIDLVVGLVRGLGTYYNEALSVTKLDHERVEVVFNLSQTPRA